MSDDRDDGGFTQWDAITLIGALAMFVIVLGAIFSDLRDRAKSAEQRLDAIEKRIGPTPEPPK